MSTMNGSFQTSPTKRSAKSEELDKLYCSLAREFGVKFPRALAINGDPSQLHRPSDLADTPEDKCEKGIRFLFWTSRLHLFDCLDKFRENLWPIVKKSRVATELGLLLDAAVLEVKKEQPSARTSFSGPQQNSFSNEESSRNTSFVSESSTIHHSFVDAPNSAATSPATSFNGFSDSSGNQHPSHDLPLDQSTIFNEGSRAQEHYHIRTFPQKGLFVKHLPDGLLAASERVRYECVRLSQAYKLDIDEVSRKYSVAWENYATLWNSIMELNNSKLVPTPVPSRVSWRAWKLAGSDAPTIHRTAKLQYQNASDKELFRLTVNPINEMRQTCRFFRHFGAQRFLKLEIPTGLDSRPRYLSGSESMIDKRIEEWCIGPAKAFAGCYWQVFFIRKSKTTRKKSRASGGEKTFGYEIFLFAERGLSLKPIPVEDMVQWFLPLDVNRELALSKAFSRVELGLSKTYATLEFAPSQIREVDDIVADHTPGDPLLLGNNLGAFEERCFTAQPPKVMNDGCSRISAAAAQGVWNILKEPGPCPSAFQGRIGPWKGIWMVDSVPIPGKKGDIWIEVTPSQQKFKRHAEDLNNEFYDRNRLTFEVLKWPRKASTSRLYKEFLPILENRGISRTMLETFLKDGIDAQKQQFFTALESTQDMCKWIEDEHIRIPSTIDTESSDIIPVRNAEGVKQLLLAGFENEFPFVAKKIKILAGWYFRNVGIELDVPLPQSTYVYGVADPLQCLQPDEVHLQFSHPLSSDDPFQNLHGIEAIVGRQPALRPSDIQKIKLVNKPELIHLYNVAVFSSRGSTPLAEKLQGGDYDGDRFWFCWAPEITLPFRNAQPPQSHNPTELGITVDRTKLKDVSANMFRIKGIAGTFQSPLLGVVNRFWRKLCYHRKSIYDKDIELVVALHDFLMDSGKNGYSFTREDWNKFKKQIKDCKLVESTILEHETVSERHLFDPGNTEYYEGSWDNITDHLIFQVSRPYTLEILKAIKYDVLQLNSLGEDERISPESDLSSPYNNARETKSGIVKVVLENLQIELKKICVNWKQMQGKIGERHNTLARKERDKDSPKQRRSDYEDNLRNAREQYRRLDGRARDWFGDELAQAWFERALPFQPSRWEILKASTLYVTCEKDHELAFGCAWKELLHIKSHSEEQPHPVIPTMFWLLKMKKKRKRTVLDEDEIVESSDEEEETANQQSPPGRIQTKSRTSLGVLTAVAQRIPAEDDGDDTEEDDKDPDDSGSSDSHDDSFFETIEYVADARDTAEDTEHASQVEQISQEMERNLLETPKKKKKWRHDS